MPACQRICLVRGQAGNNGQLIKTNIMQDQFDVIIIGAGLGGLTAGAKLSREGYRVLLIEQHDIPGGCATTFKRKDYTVEVGLHELDGLDDKDMKRNIFEDLDVMDNIDFVKLPEFYRFVHKKDEFIMPHSREKATRLLIEKFPHDKNTILKFFSIIYGIKREILKYPKNKILKFLLLPLFPVLFPNLTRYAKKSIGDIMDKITDNEELKLILLTNLAYYHDDPHTLSSVFFSAGQASYFEGGYYIRGGSQKLSDYLASYIQDYGGEVIYRHLVSKILIKDGKAIGVEYKKVRGKNAPLLTTNAKFIIANAAIPNVIQMLKGESRALLEEKTSNMSISNSIITLYLGLNKAPSEFGNRHYSTFILNDKISSLHDMAKDLKSTDFASKSFTYVDYSQINSELTKNNKHLIVLATTDYIQNWNGLSREEYKKKKEEVSQIFIKRLDKVLPGISKAIDYYELATPKTIERYTLNTEGTVYGFAQTVEQSGKNRIRAKSPVDGLYFASAWAFPGGGFSGAIISGYLCGLKIIKEE